MKRSHVRLIFSVIVLLLGSANALSLNAQQPPRAAQEEFVPIDQLPPDEQLPAARLLIAAYSVAWLLVAAYLWSIWRRLGQVEREIADVTRRLHRNTGASAHERSGGRGNR